jgi:hypothetical protein
MLTTFNRWLLTSIDLESIAICMRDNAGTLSMQSDLTTWVASIQDGAYRKKRVIRIDDSDCDVPAFAVSTTAADTLATFTSECKQENTNLVYASSDESAATVPSVREPHDSRVIWVSQAEKPLPFQAELRQYESDKIRVEVEKRQSALETPDSPLLGAGPDDTSQASCQDLPDVIMSTSDDDSDEPESKRVIRARTLSKIFGRCDAAVTELSHPIIPFEEPLPSERLPTPPLLCTKHNDVTVIPFEEPLPAPVDLYSTMPGLISDSDCSSEESGESDSDDPISRRARRMACRRAARHSNSECVCLRASESASDLYIQHYMFKRELQSRGVHHNHDAAL